MIGQAVRGEKQGQAWENVPANSASSRNQYSRGYRGRHRPGGSEERVGLVSTPIRLVKKVLKQVCLSFPKLCARRSEEQCTDIVI